MTVDHTYEARKRERELRKEKRPYRRSGIVSADGSVRAAVGGAEYADSPREHVRVLVHEREVWVRDLIVVERVVEGVVALVVRNRLA